MSRFTHSGRELKAADVVSPPLNDCEIMHESKASLHFQILVLFPSLLCFSIILFFPRLMCLPPLRTLLHRSPMSLPSPHLSIILISSVLFLSRRNYQIQATQTNDNNNSAKCRRRSGPLSCCPLSHSPASFVLPLFSLSLLPRQLLAMRSPPAALSSEGRAQRRGGEG